MNILFTCAGRRRYLLIYFKEALKDEGIIVATDMQFSAPALSAADFSEKVPDIYNAEYIDATIAVCEKYHIDALISLNDLELPILAECRARFEEIGVQLVVSSQKVIDICFDKYETAKFITSIGLSVPKTFVNYGQAVEAIKAGELHFPLVLKPRWGSGSIGIEFVEDMEEMDMIYRLLLKKVKKSILSQTSVGDEYILIQEKIEGPEYGLDVMNDLKGNHVAVSVKRKLTMRAGETDKAITVDNVAVREMGTCIGQNLKHIGNLDCDILEQEGKFYVLELNPRFGGGYPFSQEAGVNMPKAIIEWLKGNDINASILRPISGKAFAKCDYLVKVEN